MITSIKKKHQQKPTDLSQNQNSDNSPLQFVDNRPQTISQRKLQTLANTSQRAKEAAQLQTIARHYAAQQKQSFQNKSPKAELTNNNSTNTIPIQKMRAYDGDNIDLIRDPRHFSTHQIKAAIDACHANGTAVPGWLKDQISVFLRDELLERLQDMQRHGGGDQGHQHYFGLVQDYVETVDALNEDPNNQIPLPGPAAQL